jgi:hypothetical protein
MCAWAIYLNFAWAGVDALPMQWGLRGHPTWFASRSSAVAFIPLLAVFIMGMITFAKKDSAPGETALVTVSLLFSIQAVWVLLARRYV